MAADFGPNSWAIHELEGGFLMAFHAVQAVVQVATAMGVEYLDEGVVPPAGKGRLGSVATRSGRTVQSGTFVFACGPWLPKLFPDLLGERIFLTRQEVFYFGPPPGDARFRIDRHPGFENVWLAGGGSGHGFKHGSALGEYVAARIVEGGPVETRFSLATKGQVQKRAVY